MEFWGAEVKAGEPLKVEPIDGKILHLSQACLGETKKGVDHGVIYVKVGDQKLVLGSLSSEKIPQLSFDLVFEKEFELSHNLKNGSVHFCGYQTFIGEEDEGTDDSESDSDEGEDFPLNLATENGIAIQKVAEVKPAAAKTNAAKPETSEKQKVKIQDPSEDDSDDESDDSDEGDSDDESDEDMLEGDSDDVDEGSDEEEEETPTPKKISKKRPNESASKTPVPVKKAKQVTPQKTDGKKGGVHTATPHPAKKVSKTPATGDKPKPQTPKSGGSEHSCKSCTKTFGSDGALQSHNKAKHSAAK